MYQGTPTVGAVFRNTKYAENHEKTYTYMVPEDMQPKLGDLGIVEKDGIYSIVTIVRVDKISLVDPKADYQYKWLVGIVDASVYNEKIVSELSVLNAMRAGMPDRV